jgi:hypothetical protein
VKFPFLTLGKPREGIEYLIQPERSERHMSAVFGGKPRSHKGETYTEISSASLAIERTGDRMS